ncbi:MAG: hypothetical protein RLZZ338_1784 [Cyanobacteriota bacterium]|jgi:hypothetical protein
MRQEFSPRAGSFQLNLTPVEGKVGAGSPKFLPPINNLNKPAPTPPIISIEECFGAGFYHLSVIVNDIGERARLRQECD